MATGVHRADLDGGLDRAAIQRRTLRVIVAGQVFGGAAIGVGSAVSPLLAKDILGDDTFAGLSFAAFALGASLAALPLSTLMGRRGRRVGLCTGYLVATAGAVTAVVAAETELFVLLLGGMLLFGTGTAANLLARYAGADLAAADHRARAISIVVWATTLGAVAGPNVLGPAGRVATALGLPRLAGPYLVASACFLVAAAVVWGRLRPEPMVVAGLLPSAHSRRGGPGADRGASGRLSLRHELTALARRPPAVVGLAAMAVAQGVMVSVMTMTPLHMSEHGGSLEIVGFVISLHLAGMYAFAPLVGAYTDRRGPLPVARTSAAVIVAASALAAGAGHRHFVIGVALIVLGIGWSMATISGSTLLTASTPPEHRVRVQGIADMTMGLTGAVGGIVSSLVVGAVGYQTLAIAGAFVAAGLLGFLLGRHRIVGSPPVAADTLTPL